MDYIVQALQVLDSKLYAGGEFRTAGNVVVNGIAVWDGTQWSGLDNGIVGNCGKPCPPGVRAIQVWNNKLVVGGRFATVGTVPVQNLAQWDGTHWSGFEAGYAAPDAGVNDLKVQGGTLEVLTSGISVWDGSAWTIIRCCDFVNAGLTALTSLTRVGSRLYLGGWFDSVTAVAANNLAVWDGTTWSNVTNMPNLHVNAFINAIATRGDHVIVGGSFRTAGPLVTNGIADWDGSAWQTVGNVLPNLRYVGLQTLTMSGTDVYAGGYFSVIGDISASNIARWDGSAWHPLGKGVDGLVTAIAVDGTKVYAGGLFHHAGKQRANGLAWWDGTRWHAIKPSGQMGSISINSMVVLDHSLYLGGYFTLRNPIHTEGILKWDGSGWSIPGGGTRNLVNALVTHGHVLYAGGSFVRIGNRTANGIAKWNGRAWSALGKGVRGCAENACAPSVKAIAVGDNALYVGGGFERAGTSAANNIAKWDGKSWMPLGSGVDYGVMALGILGTQVYVGGSFSMAGGKSSPYFAVWHEPN